MFSNTFNIIKDFTDEFGNQIMGRIVGDSYYDDRTAIATLRALLFERLPKDDIFSFNIVKEEALFPKTAEQEDNFQNKLIIAICKEDISPALKNCQTGFAAQNEGFQLLENVTNFINKWMDGTVFIRPEINSAVVFIDSLDIRKLHFILSFIPAYYPSLFKNGKPLTQKEIKLCAALTKKTSKRFTETLEEIATELKLEDNRTAFILNGFYKQNLDALTSQARQRADRARDYLEEILRRYNESVLSYNRELAMLEGYLSRSAQDDEELINFFNSNPKVRIESAENGVLAFVAHSTLTWFDTEFYERASAREAIYDIDASGEFASMSNRKLLMDAIFADDPKLFVKVCYLYKLSMEGNVNISRHWADDGKFANYMLNPHLNYHACLGNYVRPIIDAIRTGNVIGAISQCIASVESINIAETSATFKPFMKDLFRTSKKVIVDAQGKEYTPIEALHMLQGEES